MESYNHNRTKHLAAWIGWLSVMVFLLIPYFHVYRLYILLVSGLYLLYAEVIKLAEAEKKDLQLYPPLTDSMGRLTGVTSLTFFGWYLVSFWPLSSAQWRSEEINYRIKCLVGSIPGMFSKENSFLLLFTAALLVIAIIKINPGKSQWLDWFYKYLKFGMVFFFLFCTWTGNAVVGRFYLWVMGIFLLADILKWRNSPTGKIKASLWFKSLSVVMLLAILLEDRMRNQMMLNGFFEYSFCVKLLSLQNVLFISVVFLAVAAVCWYYKEENSKFMKDEHLMLILESALLVCFMLYKCYVGYWWLVLVGYVFLSLAAVLQDGILFKPQNSAYALLAVGFLVFEAHRGKVLFALALIASIVAIVLFYRRKKSEKSAALYYASAIAAVIGIALTTVSRIFEARSLGSNYIALMIIAVLFIGFIYFMGYNPGMFVNNEDGEKGMYKVILTLFLVLCLGLSFKSGTSIKIKENGKKVDVSVKARGKENSVETAEIYWCDDVIEEIVVNKGKTLPKEFWVRSFSEEGTFNYHRTGRFKVVATDKHGIKTTAVRWYRVCQYQGADVE